MPKRKIYTLVAVLLVVGGSYYWYSKTHSASKAVQYITATAEKGMLTTSISGSGNVIVDQSSNIDPTITGTVTGLAVNIGDKVKKGQLLFNIENDQLSTNVAKSSSSLAQAQSSLESARAQEKQAKADAKSGKANSAQQKAVNQKKADAAEEDVLAAEQSLASAQADLSYQQEQSAKRKVTSPIDGTVNAINIKNGDDLSKLSSGSSREIPIIIGDLGTMKAQVQVNEVDIANVTIGQKAMMTFDAVDGITVSGKVEKMDSLGTINQGVVTYNVTIDFDTLDQRIKPQMSVSASIITDVKQNVMTVPNSAVKMQGNSAYVEVLNGTTPTQVGVEVGVANNTDTEIISGVNPGDKVVTQTINPNTTSASSTSSSGQRSGAGGGNRGGFGIFH